MARTRLTSGTTLQLNVCSDFAHVSMGRQLEMIWARCLGCLTWLVFQCYSKPLITTVYPASMVTTVKFTVMHGTGASSTSTINCGWKVIQFQSNKFIKAGHIHFDYSAVAFIKYELVIDLQYQSSKSMNCTIKSSFLVPKRKSSYPCVYREVYTLNSFMRW